MNFAITKDSWLTSKLWQKNITYFKARNDYTQIGTRLLDAGWSLFSIEIDLDEDYMINQRTVLTLVDSFSIVGGLMGVLFFAGKVIT